MAAGISLRDWTIDLADYETEDDFRQAVATELAEFEHMGERLGVGLVAAPIRRALSDGGFYTAGWLFKTATVPPARGGVEDAPDEVERLAAALAPAPDDVALVED